MRLKHPDHHPNKAKNYSFITAGSGESAVTETCITQFRILFCWTWAADIDGVRLFAHSQLANVPIIVISALVDSDKIDALDAGRIQSYETIFC
jgi:DNA-binding response OmpR family regulator